MGNVLTGHHEITARRRADDAPGTHQAGLDKLVDQRWAEGKVGAGATFSFALRAAGAVGKTGGRHDANG